MIGKNQCRLCGTPDVQIKDGHQTCAGCGKVCLYDLSLYLQRTRKRITFDEATRRYEVTKKRCQVCESFGNWLIGRNFEVIAKP